MYIEKYSALVHMAETHSQARASFAIGTCAKYFPIYSQKPINIYIYICYISNPYSY